MEFDKRHDIWVEKYRPKRIRDLILPEKYLKKFEEYSKNPTNILMVSLNPGTGKTSTLNAIIKETGTESLFINASLENGIDTLRGKISQFASTESLNGKPKIVVLDECLEENEKIIVLDKNGKEVYKKLNQLEKNKKYKCISFNLKTKKVENDTLEVVSDKEDDIYEVELEDGRIIKVTSNHPFIVNKDGELKEISIDSGLREGDDLVCREEYDLPEPGSTNDRKNFYRKYNLGSPERFYKIKNKIEESPRCKFCDKKRTFKNIFEGYKHTCGSSKCLKKLQSHCIDKMHDTTKKYDVFILKNKDFYENVKFPFKDIYDNNIVRDLNHFVKKSFSKLKIFDKKENCVFCKRTFTSNIFRNPRKFCSHQGCRKYGFIYEEYRNYSEIPFKIFYENYKHKYLSNKKLLGVYNDYKKFDLKDNEFLRILRKTGMVLNGKFIELNSSSTGNKVFSFKRNNIIEPDMLSICKRCGCSFLKYDKKIINGKLKKVLVAPRKCKRNIDKCGKCSKFNPATKEFKLKQSERMKKLIKEGKFTPQITNSWTNSRHDFGFRKRFRSSWEAYFYVFHKNRNIDLEFEKIRIPYYNSEQKRERIYLVDFYDPISKKLYEIKPDSERGYQTFKDKDKALKEYCLKNNLKFEYISDSWFFKHYNIKELDNLDLNERENLMNKLKQFERSK